jgi:hypothetical protein
MSLIYLPAPFFYRNGGMEPAFTTLDADDRRPTVTVHEKQQCIAMNAMAKAMTNTARR